MVALRAGGPGRENSARRRRRGVAIAVLLIGWLAWAPTPGAHAQGQRQLAPVAIATVEVAAPADPSGPAMATLDGSSSFDPEPGGGIVRYEWEVVTEAYSWLPIAHAGEREPTAVFEVPNRALAHRYGYEIEFKLTVTARGPRGARASDTAAISFAINRAPTAHISVSAMLLDPDDIFDYDDDRDGLVDDNAERYTIDGVIDGPGEIGNADNEWDITEGSLLVVDGSASSDPDGPLDDGAFSWQRIYASDVPHMAASVPDSTAGVRALSTDEDPRTASQDRTETAGLLIGSGGRDARPFLVYYQLTVTDDRGASDSHIVKIVIRDDVAEPTVEILEPVAEPPTGVQPAGEDRYVVSPDAARAGVALTALGTADGRSGGSALTHTWSGQGVTPGESNSPGNRSFARFAAPAGTAQGDEFTVSATVQDMAGRTASASVVLVVADNTSPQAIAPEDQAVTDGPRGGDDGTLTLRGIAFDPDGDPLALRWQQVSGPSGDPLGPNAKPRLSLGGAGKGTAAQPEPQAGRDKTSVGNTKNSTDVTVTLPELEAGQTVKVYLEFSATDRWGVSDSDIVAVVITDGETEFFGADAGPGQLAAPEALVRLDGARSYSPAARGVARRELSYQWEYAGITADPPTQHRAPITAAEAVQGFAPGEWLPYADGSYHPTAGGRLQLADRAHPYFFAPGIGRFNSVKLAFRLTFGDGTEQGADTVTVTVTGRFYSGPVDSPDFCPNRSLGGPTTYAHDHNGDGIADTCSLDTTRRAAIARHNALETLASLYTDTFETALHGQPDDPDTADVDESAAGACAAAPDDLGDTEAALAADVCGRAEQQDNPERTVSPRPPPVDPVKARRFFSGPITGPSFCANRSLGGPTTHPYDSDGDGIADVCALAYTRREAAARHNALRTAFLDYPQYGAALAAACAKLGTLDFGDHPDDLAQDLCNPAARQPRGEPLPTPRAP